MYRCPDCDSTDLEVSVVVWATLLQTEEGFETDATTPDDASHDWSDQSMMRCRDCGTERTAAKFNDEEETE